MGPLLRLVTGICTVLLVLAGADGQNRSTKSYICTLTPGYDRGPNLKAGSRFPEGAVLLQVTNGEKRELAPGFAASAEGAVSFDGKNVLFAGKQKRGDPWQIWEVGLSGGTPRRVTSFQGDAIAPLYVSNERIVYAHRTRGTFQLETALLSGKDAMRLTYGPGDHVPTAVLRDGRVLFDAPQAGGGRDLYTVYIDGSGVESYRCDHGRDRHSGAELSSGDVVFESGGSLARFTSARAIQVALPAVKGEFAGRVAGAAPGELLVAFRPDAGQPFGIYSWRSGRSVPERISAPAALHAVDPVIVAPHPVPKRHPSALGDRQGANLLCLSAYISKSSIPSGAAASVRVWALDDAGAAIALGQAPVESDGSFFVQTPTERAIRFELLDRAGKTVAAEKGWFWARRGEQRVCVGCHAGPERSPENATPAVLLRNTEPVKMALPRRAARGVAK